MMGYVSFHAYELRMALYAKRTLLVGTLHGSGFGWRPWKTYQSRYWPPSQ